MAAPNDDEPGCTNWEVAAVAYNRVNDLAPNRHASFYLLTAHSQALNPAVYCGCLPIDMPDTRLFAGGVAVRATG